MPKEIILSYKAPKPVGPYSQAVRVGDSIFFSGMLPINQDTNKMMAKDIVAQTRVALKNIEAILASAGANLSNVVKTTVLLADMEDFTAMNEVYQEFFEKDPPARTTFEVGKLPLGSLIEIEAIAYVG